jgi:hypothetical protein
LAIIVFIDGQYAISLPFRDEYAYIAFCIYFHIFSLPLLFAIAVASLLDIISLISTFDDIDSHFRHYIIADIISIDIAYCHITLFIIDTPLAFSHYAIIARREEISFQFHAMNS